jgi:hypothetical protein
MTPQVHIRPLLKPRNRQGEFAMRNTRTTGRGDLGPTLKLEAPSATAPITIRPAYGDDDAALARLAELDSAAVPASPILVAEVDGELRAALSLPEDTLIADPFYPTVHLARLLRAQASATAREPRGGRRRSYRLGYA